MNLRSLIVVMLVTLAGCATTAHAPPPAPPVVVSAATWQQVDREIVEASRSATEQTRIYSRGAMDYWRTRVYELTEQNFIPWFSSYWTQEWLSMKVSWYTISAKGEQDAAEQRLADYLLEAYQEKVLAPAALEVDPDLILTQSAAFYVDILKEELQKISQRHGVPMEQLNGRIQKIPAIALGPPPARNASLYQVVRTEPLTTLPAYSALVDKVHKAGGSKGVDSTENAMAPVAKRASRRMEAEMAPRGAASAVAAAAGKLAGGLITVGVAGIRALIEASDRPDSEALIRSSLGNTFDKAWMKLVQNPTSGVMASTLYMAGQIEGSLAASTEPSVGLSTGSVEWTPPQTTTPQNTP
ncbi:hypothetical protein [Pseudomonas vancouverensis]|uniref:Lipoprotein n=1 Tax=Pseudomonas vancouverensis TaxID=95300 RepID=A0A1H2NQZ6_PSEVA|nr:hypothetical protein [Pseudomonas vancouverensis]KAB0491191.1 hypothetical protein F7R09_26190 [Pseudomonas vancouverensis]TDB59597.1 hypothetical protein EIY72_18470 [Pseudomonas vancouverensis]SDV07917.1 hypothetical protein SAMN05216558_2801 [Pseudomonas vancouverensis]